MNEIFLSYKRSDDPGYVARLADSLERVFGEGTVYRDVDSERAGGNWKKSLARNVSMLPTNGITMTPCIIGITGVDNSLMACCCA